MTTEEKLQHFVDFCMEDARNRSINMLEEYTSAIEKSFDEHQEEALQRAQMQIDLETEKIERDINKKLSIEQINLKRTLSQKQEELKDKLFAQLTDMLAKFMETPEYQALLEAQVQQALAFAGKDEMVIYMDPVDETLSRTISLKYNVGIKLSQYSFLGGIRAVISHKNILIDNSFQSKLDEAKQTFHFNLDLGGITHV